MLGRLIVGALIGVILGAAVAALLVKGLGIIATGAILAYVSAAVVGLLTGLFAGKPIWAAGGQIEAGLKAFFGALLAAGAMFALRSWVKMDVDLSRFGAGAGLLGEVPAASLPLIAGVLGAFFGLDNTPDSNADAKPPGGATAASGAGVRVAAGKGSKPSAADEADEEQEVGTSKRARR